ncbi:MAG: hypothetical protein ACLTN1_10480, partial [Acutalibacteraceae bacterium]
RKAATPFFTKVGLACMVNSFKQSLKHWKNACRRETPPAAKRQRHFSQRLALRVWYNSFKQSLKHWKNACRRETPPVAMRQRHF